MAIGAGGRRFGGDEGLMSTGMLASDDHRFRWALVIAVVPALWLAPAVSGAQDRRVGDSGPTPFATLKLYEVQEATDLRSMSPEDRVLRLANAALVGTASGSLLCTAGQDPCAFDTLAKSAVPLHLGVGALTGDWQVMFDDELIHPDGNPLLSDLVLVAKGSVTGTLDLRPLLTGKAPMALMKGQWKSKALDVRGTFSGTFLVPFADPTKQCATGFAYFDPSAGLQCVNTNETSLGRPLTKVVATFLKTGTFGPGDKDDDAAGGPGRN
jgi:hypothetical protein